MPNHSAYQNKIRDVQSQASGPGDSPKAAAPSPEQRIFAAATGPRSRPNERAVPRYRVSPSTQRRHQSPP